MRITEELREIIPEIDFATNRDRLRAIADRIDGRWEQEEADFDLMTNKIAAQARCLVEVGEALGVSADQPDSEFFWELAEAARGCIQLPKDADGETIHLGDELEYKYGRFVVRDLTFYVNDSREGIFWSTDDPINEEFVGLGGQVGATPVHHAQPDSWERIISDALRADRTDAYAVSTSMLCELAERCKRLAGEAE